MPKAPVTRINGAFQVQADSVGNPNNATNYNGFYAPQLTTAQIAAIPAGTLVNGAIVYNTTTNTFQVYKSSAWTNISTGAATTLTAPSLTTATAPAATNGAIYYDTTTNQLTTAINAAYNVVVTAASTTLQANAATVGNSTLVAGTVTVATTAVAATSHIFLQTRGNIGAANAGNVYVSAITVGRSFVITSSNNADISVVNWFIVNA